MAALNSVPLLHHLYTKHESSYCFLNSRSLAATSQSPSSLWICEGDQWSGPLRTSRARSMSSRYGTQWVCCQVHFKSFNVTIKVIFFFFLTLPQLKTRQGTELLIQSEIDSVINDWYRALTETINTHVRRRIWLSNSRDVRSLIFECYTVKPTCTAWI